MLFCDASFVTVAASTLATEAEQEYIQRPCTQTVSCTVTCELLFDFHIWTIFHLSSLSVTPTSNNLNPYLSLISVTICEFSGVLNLHGCLSKFHLSDLNIFLLLHDDTNPTNEPIHNFFNAWTTQPYSICLQTCICRSQQLHNLFRFMRLHFSYHRTKKPITTIYFACVRFRYLSSSKNHNLSLRSSRWSDRSRRESKNGPSMTCLCRFAPHVVCTQCSSWRLILCGFLKWRNCFRILLMSPLRPLAWGIPWVRL